MAKKASLGSAKRFGPRYGRRNKEKVAALEDEHRGRRKCPYCNYVKVKRESKGIWVCDKCGVKFAGKAYTVAKPKKIKETAKEEEIIEEDVQEEQVENLEELDAQESDDGQEEAKRAELDSDIPPELQDSDEEKEEVSAA